MLLKDTHLWDGTTEVYLHGYPFALSCTGEEVVDGNVHLDSDRRLLLAMTRTGVRCVLYRHPDGFKKIILKDMQ